MKKTTLCYIQKDDSYLMLHRTKKKDDINEGKWIGIGGKFLPGESEEGCLIREAKEETGLTLLNYELKGIVTFLSDIYDDEEMYLYTCDKFVGQLTDCNEGELKWIKKEDIFNLNLWEGDKIFLKLLFDNQPYFTLCLKYKKDMLTEAILNNQNIIF